MASRKLTSAILFFAAIGAGTATCALAVTAEVAKKCEILTAKAFPPREVGNPAAGSAKGSSQMEREYFGKCVANGGKAEDDPKETK